MTAPSLRDAIAYSSGDDCPECGAPSLDEQVAAARKWMAEWLRSDEANSVGGYKASRLADALTKEADDAQD